MWILKVRLDSERDCISALDMLALSNYVPFISIFRRETEGGLHHPGTRRCGTHDRGNAHEEHYQSR